MDLHAAWSRSRECSIRELMMSGVLLRHSALLVQGPATRLVTRLRGRPRPVHFLHVGKTGGTAVKHALGPVPPENGRFVLRVETGHEKSLRDVPPGEAVFFFVREPVARFVSAFYSRQRQGGPCLLHPWTAGEANAFAIYQGPNELAEALSAPGEAKRREARAAMRAIAHVNTSYARWCGRPPYFTSRCRAGDVLFVGRQETLAAGFERLKTILGLPPGLALPTDDNVAHRAPRGLDRSLSETAAANIRRWYAADYEFIALCERLGLLSRHRVATSS